ncbi:MAG: hypothetical protein H0W20_13235 [Chthoniobacterales bacterium]|nr:hypothetical protein [Chthoniobacterales bacterium]
MTGAVHILSQYIWPDSAPTAIYAEQLADRLQVQGCDVRLVGGQGGYRALERSQPGAAVHHLPHYRGRRGNLPATYAEYHSVTRAFRRYINEFVARGDTVIVTSAPPNTVGLANAIQRRGARSIHWLQDYYPELIRGLHEYPHCARRVLSAHWDRQLSRWDHVVKIGANLGGPEHNSVVIRNWPTLDMRSTVIPEPRTALYSGNFGYGHDVQLFVNACEKLRDEGYTLTIRADGRGVRHLPAWLNVQPLHKDPQKLREDLLRHETHIVAAHPKITRAVFPSKIWNSIAAGRKLVCTGFDGEMRQELEAARNAPFDQHLQQWSQLVLGAETHAESASRERFAEPGCSLAELHALATR